MDRITEMLLLLFRDLLGAVERNCSARQFAFIKEYGDLLLPNNAM